MHTQPVAPSRMSRWIPAVLALAVLAGCASVPRVSTDYDPRADFSHYRTWAFYEPITMENAGYASFLTERIRADVRREMEQRGYRYAEASPDVRVNFQTDVQDRLRVSPGFYDPFAYGGRWGWGGPWGWRSPWGFDDFGYGYGYGRQNVDSYREGTLVIDVVDSTRKQLAWTGTAASRVSSRKTPEERAQRLDVAVAEIFRKYPYQAGSARPANMPAR